MRMETVTNTQFIDTVVKYSVTLQTKGKMQKASIMYTNSSEKIESSRAQPSEQQNNPTEKHTKGRKGRACFRTVRKAVKRSLQTLKNKVCPRVPDQKPSQEDPQTSRREPTEGTDPLESQPVFDYAQASQSSAVASAESSSDVFVDAFEYLPEETESSRAQAPSGTIVSAEKYPSSFPTDAPEQQNNPAGRKGRARFRTVRKAVKRSFQILKHKVCPRVADQEPSQENPQTPRQEPTAGTDPLESQPVFDYPQATQSSAVASAESSSDVFEDAFEYLPEETESAVVSAEKYPSSCPTDAPEQQNNPTEKHTKRPKGRACFWTVRKALKRSFQTLKTKACPCVPEQEPLQENPQTPRQEPKGYDFFEIPQIYPFCNLRLQDEAEYFRSLYEVGEELAIGRDDCVHVGIRRRDDQQVLIKFSRRHFANSRLKYPESACNAQCDEAIMLLTLQRPLSCDHVVRLYDWYTLKKQDILIMEYPHPCVTLCEFIRQNRRCLNEEIARRIMLQLTVALRHCLDRGVLYYSDTRRIFINTDTLQLKLMNFKHARFLAAAENDPKFLAPMVIAASVLEAIKSLSPMLDELIDGFPPWEQEHLSEDCRDLRLKLGSGGPPMIDVLEDIIDHPWFRDLSTANEGEG